MNKKQFKYGAVISYVTIFFNIAAGIIYSPWVLRKIGDDDYALFTIAMSLISIFALDFGIGSAVSKYVSDYITDRRNDKVEKFLGIICRLYLIIDAVIFVILLAVYLNLASIYSSFDPEYLHKFEVVYLIMGIFTVLQFPLIGPSGALVSYERFIFSKGIVLIQKITIILIMIFLLTHGGGVYELVLVNSGAEFICYLIRYLYCRNVLHLKIDIRFWDLALVRQIFSFSIWMTVIMLAQRLFYNIAPSVLAKYVNSIEINRFNFASSIEGYFYTIGIAVYGMFISKVTALSKGENPDQNLLRLMQLVGRFQFMILGLIFVGWVSIGDAFVKNVWLGEQYASVYLFTIILMIPDILLIPQQIAEMIMITQNKIYYQAVIYMIAGGINLLLAMVFVPRMGALGMCISISIAQFARFVMMNAIYYRKLSIDVFKFAKQVYLKMIPFCLAVMGIGFLMNIVVYENNLGVVAVKGGVIVCIYGLLVFLFVLTNEEKQMLFDIRSNRRN